MNLLLARNPTSARGVNRPSVKQPIWENTKKFILASNRLNVNYVIAPSVIDSRLDGIRRRTLKSKALFSS